MTARDHHAPQGHALPTLRLGIDLGGTKIAGIALDHQGATRATTRRAAPQGSLAATITAIAEVVATLERDAGHTGSIGIGMPGSLSARGLIQGANSVWLNGVPFQRDLEAAFGRPVRLANDANCFALSEAVDGAGQNARSVFGVIIGTGCGGGLVFGQQIIDGPNGIAGEWGHNPLPWADPTETPGHVCYCGRTGCIETWVSGPALSADHARANGVPISGVALSGEALSAAADAGDHAARATLTRHASRLARGLASVVNVFDPEVIVLGGGLSKLAHLYVELPALMAPYVFADAPIIDIRPPRWGDASGVRGAAWLWGR
jgi:fructokinase